MKHTPEPWKINRKATTRRFVIVDAKGWEIAAVCHDDTTLILSNGARHKLVSRPEGEAEANAALIAAAPELCATLKASESLLRRLRACNADFIQEINEAIEQARAALERAEGRADDD